MYFVKQFLTVYFIFSSFQGTTGSPKAATLSHFNQINNAHIVGNRAEFNWKVNYYVLPEILLLNRVNTQTGDHLTDNSTTPMRHTVRPLNHFFVCCPTDRHSSLRALTTVPRLRRGDRRGFNGSARCLTRLPLHWVQWNSQPGGHGEREVAPLDLSGQNSCVLNPVTVTVVLRIQVQCYLWNPDHVY